ncbi:MAG: hypothetical protein K0R28_3127, partial [Paenibacillus sp.]|nr:hypothetical protein [Paenibacillus sp.]
MVNKKRGFTAISAVLAATVALAGCG